ncbi:phosphatases II [Pyrrhoderma noxium]|uniref:Phosphatases II n=1 Tax=Pyrrhoderma noxium TaxID=2282107 RepID=A0A286UMU9_9AGAM|nr:phosphatases II [Pyrrhoderma noxium]
MPWRNVDPIIEDRLFLGNIIAARSPRSLSERKISHIVSVCEDAIPADSPSSGFRHIRIPVKDVDYADLLIHLPRACEFIHQALKEGGIVLVHCEQGLSRSATVVAAYLMFSRRISSTDALEIIRRAREQVWPNPGFHQQLVLFELCQYKPSPSDGIYRNWRDRIEREIRERGLPC